MNKVFWTIFYEAYRLWGQMIEYYVEDCLANNDPSLATLDWLYEYTKELCKQVEQSGPILKEYPVTSLPLPWRDCKSEKELREMNIFAQQMLIHNEYWPLLELLTFTASKERINL